MNVYNTACPRNCYSTCTFKVFTENGKIIKIAPQALNKATPEGVCLKGLSYIERANSEKRILYPLRKQKGRFIKINLNQALDEISEKLQKFKKEFGSHSVLFYSASGMSGTLNGLAAKFWELYGGTTGVYGNLCWPAGLEATRLSLGEIKHNAPWDIEHAKLIILWGKNPAETNIQQMIPIEKAQSKGAKLIVIDPRRTPSAERADLLLQPLPGTDGILALAIAKLLIENEQVDIDFIEQYVHGYPQFKNKVLKINIKEAAKECGIPVNFMQKLAHALGTIKPASIVPGYGMQRYTNGGQTIRCLLALTAITGNIGKQGAGWHYADLQGDIFSQPKEPLNYYPNEQTDQPFRRKISTARLGEDMLKINNPELKMIWTERGNPLAQNPNSNLIYKAFEKLDFKVTVEQFMTDTAKASDIVLPAKNMFEQSDLISSYWNPYIQIRQKVIEPTGEVKPETEIYYLLAQKLGFDETVIQELFPISDEAVEQKLKHALRAFPEISLEKLKQAPQLPPGYQEIAFSDLKFNTPSGKIELLSETAHKKWGVNPLPSYEKLKEDSRMQKQKFPFQLLSPNTKNRIHSQFGNLKSIQLLSGKPEAIINMGDAQKKSIQTGDSIEVFNDRGKLKITARCDASLRPGCIVIHNGYWHSEGACPNSLSKGRETDMGHGTAFHDNAVDYIKSEQ